MTTANISMENALIIPDVESGLKLSNRARPDYANLTEEELHDAFVKQFERLLTDESEEPKPGLEQVAHRSMRLGGVSLGLGVDYDIGSVFRNEPEHTHRRERKLSVPRGLLVLPSGEETDEPLPLPVEFKVGEFYGDGEDMRTSPWRGQQRASIRYGVYEHSPRDLDRQQLLMSVENARKSFGVGIEVLKLAAKSGR